MRDTEVFEGVAAQLPVVAEMISPDRASPLDQARAGAGLVNSYRPQAAGAGLLAIGDAVLCTNPMGGRGVTLGVESFVADAGARTGALYLALRAAAEMDPLAAELYTRWERERLETMRAGPVAAVQAAGLLRPEVTADEAAAILALLIDPSLRQRMVVDQGWRPDRFREWLARTMIEQVIAS